MLNHVLQKSLKTVSLTGLLFLTGLSAGALESDREQAIRIQADAAMVDERAGTSVYRGNVIIQQGTLKVTAEEVEIFTSDSEIIQIIAKADQKSSNLAHYQQQLNANNDRVSAEAKKITYLVQEERLHLAGDAKLQQIDDEFEGELLYYDLAKGIVNLSAGGKNDRINMTISPKKSNP
jgi:lipopolysaccharide export system protein LptA